ncbi:hypothetical protein ACFWY9_28120 [Amycolatopsis sp. NPDC059027]|uniref:hypothetical protein n=1 Tax=Amycolatopsis sp. NPDC059027 TaxID=3346709 RepID=UPI00366F0A14
MSELVANHRLRAVMSQAGVSHKGLARRVDDLGAAAGLDLRYGHTAVARWLAGRVPRPPVPTLIADALGAKLGHPISPADIGMAPSGAENAGFVYSRGLGQAVDAARTYWSTVDRRTFAVALPCAAVFLRPLARWVSNPREEDAGHRGGPRIGMADVERLRVQAEAARHLDSAIGGLTPSAMVDRCLATEAAPLLGGTYTDAVGRELFSAVSVLTRLSAWSAFDTGVQREAQARFVQALRYAQAAGDVQFGAYTLASAAFQAVYLGDAETAIDLAQGASAIARHSATPRVLAFVRIAEARGHARAGDRPATEAALSAAEGLLERADAERDEDPPYIDFLDHSRMQADAAEAYLALGVPARVIALTDSATHIRPGFTRSHGLRLSVLAAAHASAGEAEGACSYGREAVTTARHVNSSRLDAYLRHFGKRLGPLRAAPGVPELLAALPRAQ